METSELKPCPMWSMLDGKTVYKKCEHVYQLEFTIHKLRADLTPGQVTAENNEVFECNACGDAENCDIHCKLETELEPKCCPVSGDDCEEWRKVTSIKPAKGDIT